MQQVSFIQMKDGTAEEYAFLDQHEKAYIKALPERVLSLLEQLGDTLDGYTVSRLEHSLQSASRAEADGCDEEMIVAALLHDIGDMYAPANHSEFAAALLRPYVRPELAWVLEKHGEFQMYYWAHHMGKDRNIRDQYKDHPWYQSCVDFCEKYDQNCFDPDYPSKPISHFAPMVRRVLAWPKY
ncbi:HD domain-containing protein [Marinobacterium jannaschii]|uniref:HD domain-containing protein n=1 Tax=Marinobacterium jannaschii TaxID=64970 RepID=UPI000485DD3C|nr:HD domain-containing protein [Marinobacterium jannaschii]